MKKIFGVLITIGIFVLNFVNLTFAKTEKLSKPPRFTKSKASDRVNLREGKPIPANEAGYKEQVYPKVETTLNGEVYPKVEMHNKYDESGVKKNLKMD